ncbi:MAG TPA: ABC transporter permease subunit [Stackebrandtia sp.]|jgi:ABC-2 type transport system permease protein|uniref:ABC transporter permease n=1 Tax=Stackebrandtia sp. TaxID=2023065 RepID=UPI002D2E6BA3|nr:ABC transporter permease subunit [Stackebrandtia sp.]HZE38959.1 ABC transporter permease subunit [Stackebrandtia sp.]
MNGTVARLTRMNLLRGWRGALLTIFPFAQLLLSVGVRFITTDTPQGQRAAMTFVLGGLTMGTVVPLIALIVGTGAISTEVDDGSIVYLLTKPLKRWKIVVTKFVVATVAAIVLTAVPTYLAGLIISGSAGGAALVYGVAAAISCVVYCALFVLLGVLSRQAVIIGLMYILLWENLIAGLVSGAKVLSVQYWSVALAAKLAPGTVSGEVNVIAAAVLAAVVTVGAVVYAGRRLRSLTLASEA